MPVSTVLAEDVRSLLLPARKPKLLKDVLARGARLGSRQYDRAATAPHLKGMPFADSDFIVSLMVIQLTCMSSASCSDRHDRTALTDKTRFDRS